MVTRKGIMGIVGAFGAAMLFVVSAAGAMFGGYDLNDSAVTGNAAGTDGVDTVLSTSTSYVADDAVEGYVLDNATGEGIVNATVIIIHIPDNVSQGDVNAYVDKVLSVLRLVRNNLNDRRDKLEMMTDEAQQKLENASERLELANQTLCEKRERLQDAIAAVKDLPGGAGRHAMKRIETACMKFAAEEKRLESGARKLNETVSIWDAKLRNMTEKLTNEKERVKDRLASKGIIITRTDETGHYTATAVNGSTVIVALAPGYAQGRLGAEIPVNDGAAISFRLEAKPQVEVYRVWFVWGYLDRNDPAGEFMAWNGSISVSDGAVRLVRTVQFEHRGDFMRGGSDKVYAQTEKSSLSWRSSTTVARDGVVVDISVPAGIDGAKVTLTAGDWSETVGLTELVGQRTRTSVDDAGHEVLVACELLGEPAK
jgi:hypothetical protein